MAREYWFRIAWNSSVAWALLATFLLLGINSYWLSSNDNIAAPPLPHGDGPDYESLAYSLSVGNRYEFAWEDPKWQEPYRKSDLAFQYTQLGRRDWPGPTTARPPALPWLISQIYRWVPRGPQAFACVRWMSVGALSIAGGLAVWLAGNLARKHVSLVRGNSQIIWNLHAIACAVALAMAAIDRTIKTYVNDFLTEPWALLAVSCFAISLLAWSDSPWKLRWIILAGWFFGSMVLFRSLYIFWLPVIVIGVVLVSRRSSRSNAMDSGVRRWWIAPVLFGLVVSLIVGPWWIRNCSVTGRLMPMGAQGAASLRGGYSDEALQDWGNWHAEAEISMQSKLDATEGSEDWTAAQREVALSDLAARETWTWVQDHWLDLPRLGAMRWITHWGPWRIDHVAWKCAAMLGLFWVWRSRWHAGVVIASILIADGITTIGLYETGGRFLIPLHGVLYGLSGVGIAGCLALVWGNLVHPMHEQTEPQ